MHTPFSLGFLAVSTATDNTWVISDHQCSCGAVRCELTSLVHPISPGCTHNKQKNSLL